MIMNGNMIKRISLYVLGLFVMTVGIAFSFRSDLGSSPVSSIPYSMMYVWAIEVGFATILFHIALVILQFLILRENFKAKILLQVVAGVLFGYFTTRKLRFYPGSLSSVSSPASASLRTHRTASNDLGERSGRTRASRHIRYNCAVLLTASYSV